MKRLISNLAAGISLLFFVATLWLWVLGYLHSDGFEEKQKDYIWLVQTVRGGFQYALVTEETTHDYSTPGWFSNPSAFEPVVTKTHFGFGRAEVAFPGQHLVAIDIPAYPFAVVFGILPSVAFGGWLRRLRIASRSSQQLCVNCGYDLRVTAERCPECGTIIQPK